jgi:exopolyphosphatase / guanosine-5'-triphosphate,3'-diphosphate pyrophosphatase
MKLSVIDLGYNSIKLVSYHIDGKNSFKVYDRRSIKLKIGKGLGENGYLSDEARRDTIESLRLFRDIIKTDNVENILPVATSAVREATNKKEFISEIYDQTGFSFRLLSHEEESLYSWCGALHSTCISDALFFDLGGGSLEIVHSENYRIKNLLSLPLGALRLTQMLNQKNGSLERKYTRKLLNRLEQYIVKYLPDRRHFGFSPDVTLVGVGGTLRTLAQYDQDLNNYPIDKLHNYKIKIERVEELSRKLSGMSVDEISGIVSIGNSRSDTVVPGCYVIFSIMKKFRSDAVVVSTEGLREGLVLCFINDSLHEASNNSMTTLRSQVENIVKASCRHVEPPRPYTDFVETLLTAGLLKEREYEILVETVIRMHLVPNTVSTNALFYIMMDQEYKNLSHSEQLVLCLSIVNTKKQKTSNRLFAKYKMLLHAPQNKRSIEKISSCLDFINVLERSQAAIHSVRYDGKILYIELRCKDISNFPRILFEEAARGLYLSFGIPIKHSLNEAMTSNDFKLKIENNRATP